MKICFVISDIKTETCGTTVVILKKAHERGHEVYVMSVGDFIFHRDEDISLRCKKIPPSVKGDKVEDFWSQIQDDALKEKSSTQQGDGYPFPQKQSNRRDIRQTLGRAQWYCLCQNDTAKRRIGSERCLCYEPRFHRQTIF